MGKAVSHWHISVQNRVVPYFFCTSSSTAIAVTVRHKDFCSTRSGTSIAATAHEGSRAPSRASSRTNSGSSGKGSGVRALSRLVVPDPQFGTIMAPIFVRPLLRSYAKTSLQD
eukprot:1598279-Rhodomonas_salina.1